MDVLAHMATFVRVVQAGSLSAAARQLHLSPAAVSRQLTGLEAHLGGALLLRSTRRLTVTEAGRRYYERALRILGEVDEASGSVREERRVCGRLTVSAPVTFGMARICPLLPALLRKHPELELDLRLEDRTVNLAAEGVDVAIRTITGPVDGGSLITHLLGAYGRQVVAAPAYLRGREEPRTPEGLLEHQALLHITGDGTYASWAFERAGQQIRVSLQGPLRTNLVYALRDGALAGLGVALLPAWLVADDVRSGRLRVLLADWTASSICIHALHRAELREIARLRAFLEYFREAWAPERETGRTPRGASRRSARPR